MSNVVQFDTLSSMTQAFSRGLVDGMAAKTSKVELTPYLRVGIDDYAQGYRSGYFSRIVTATPDRNDGLRSEANR